MEIYGQVKHYCNSQSSQLAKAVDCFSSEAACIAHSGFIKSRHQGGSFHVSTGLMGFYY